MKQCALCHRKIDIKYFNRNKSKSDGLNDNCRDCNKNYLSNYYKRNKYVIKRMINIAKNKKRNDLRTKLVEYLSLHPCVDCGENDVIVLDFDHIKDVKKANVSKLLTDAHSWSDIEAEIRKCEVRCANCHRKITAQRNKDYRWQFNNKLKH